ncbi:MAG: hypothetical protein KM310_01425 [Clostridiales bacterium]|nr:hypothetical protein [Clostridiales bacterium]
MAILWVMALPLLVLLFALLVDGGFLLWQREVLRQAADLAALAGAMEVDLEALAGGRRAIVPLKAREQVEAYVAYNTAALPSGVEVLGVEVLVVNGSPEEPAYHPWWKVTVEDPIVSLRLEARVTPFLLGRMVGPVSLRVEADASVKAHR